MAVDCSRDSFAHVELGIQVKAALERVKHTLGATSLRQSLQVRLATSSILAQDAVQRLQRRHWPGIRRLDARRVRLERRLGATAHGAMLHFERCAERAWDDARAEKTD